MLAREHIKGTSLLSYGNPNITEAVQLLTLAAEQGDIESLMDLGWLYNDKKSFQHANSNVSRVLFMTARAWEMGSITSVEAKALNNDGTSGEGEKSLIEVISSVFRMNMLEDSNASYHVGTGGLAPSLALAWLELKPLIASTWLFRVFEEFCTSLAALYVNLYMLFYEEKPSLIPASPYDYPDHTAW